MNTAVKLTALGVLTVLSAALIAPSAARADGFPNDGNRWQDGPQFVQVQPIDWHDGDQYDQRRDDRIRWFHRHDFERDHRDWRRGDRDERWHRDDRDSLHHDEHQGFRRSWDRHDRDNQHYHDLGDQR